jgi:hypothetical protein
MNFLQTLPGSKIEVGICETGSPMLTLPVATGGTAERWGPAAFLIFWLCGWAVGEVFAATALFIKDTPMFARLFLLAWLGGWTVGGIMAMRQCHALIKGPQPDILVFNAESLEIRHGQLPFSFQTARNNPRRLWSSGAPKPAVLPKGEIGKPRVEWADSRQRLTIDHGIERIEVGNVLTEPEREWLCTVIENWRSHG